MQPDPASESESDPELDPERAAASADDEGPPPGSPYKNLWAPLVVVPALIVMVLALVGLLFGAIGGEPSSAADYVESIVSGGRNERQQALFGLSQRVAEHARARLTGQETEWEVDRATIGPLLDDAWARAGEEDHEIRYVLAALMAQLEMPEGVPRLVSLLDLTEADDPEGELRFDVLLNLGALGDPRALPALARAAGDPDKGLRSIAVVGLQKQELAAARPVLVGALGDQALEVRANAAIALSRLGDPAGAAVLRDATGRAVYEAERELDPRRWSDERISTSRITALDALARLRRPEDRELVAGLAAEAGDPNVKGAAKRVLAAWEAAPEGGN